MLAISPSISRLLAKMPSSLAKLSSARRLTICSTVCSTAPLRTKAESVSSGFSRRAASNWAWVRCKTSFAGTSLRPIWAGASLLEPRLPTLLPSGRFTPVTTNATRMMPKRASTIQEVRIRRKKVIMGWQSGLMVERDNAIGRLMKRWKRFGCLKCSPEGGLNGAAQIDRG